jgi:hypothetical protein
MHHGLKLPEIIHTLYPYSTHVSIKTPVWEPRKFKVLAIRDLVLHPLSVSEFLSRPMTRRSRYLVRVRDLDRGVCRSVYHRSMADWHREAPLRVGVYHGDDLQELMATNWGPSIGDRKGLIAFLNKHGNRDMGEFRLAILSDDAEVITCDSLS